MPTAEADGGPVQLIAKVDAILGALAQTPDIGVGELAGTVGEPRSSVYRLLQSLRALEYVEPGVKRGSYRLGIRLLEFGSAVADNFDVRRSALPVMERLHDETEETVFLCVRREDDAVCIERLDGRRVQSLALRIGGALPLHSGAAPRALLAFEERDEWQAYWGRHGQPRLRAFTPNTPITKSALFKVLELTRSEGIATSDQDVTIGIAALGAPIFDQAGKPCAALSVSGVRESILRGPDSNGGALSRRIREYAAEVSRSMGHRP